MSPDLGYQELSPRRPPGKIVLNKVMTCVSCSFEVSKRLPREPCQTKRDNLELEGTVIWSQLYPSTKHSSKIKLPHERTCTGFVQINFFVIERKRPRCLHHWLKYFESMVSILRVRGCTCYVSNVFLLRSARPWKLMCTGTRA